MYTRVSNWHQTGVNLVFCTVLIFPNKTISLGHQCLTGVISVIIHEIYTDFTLLLSEFYQRNPPYKHVFILTLYPRNSGKTIDTVFKMAYLI